MNIKFLTMVAGALAAFLMISPLAAQAGVGGACCTDNTCTIESPVNCAENSGKYAGDDTTCETGTCTGACCHDEGCTQVNMASALDECMFSFNNGTYQGDFTSCGTPDICAAPPATGACCQPNGSCVEDTSVSCGQSGGSYQGDGSLCEAPFITAGSPRAVSVAICLPQGACCADGCFMTDAETCGT